MALSKSFESLDVGSSNGKAFPDGQHSTGASPARSRGAILINSAEKATPVFQRMTAESNGRLPFEKIEEFLIELDLSSDYSEMLSSIAQPGATELSLDETMALVGMLGPASPTASTSSADVSKAPLKKVLTKNRDYMSSGALSVDEAVLAYITKLDDHRKKCESEGRYPEAKAASSRLADLKTAQVERLRKGLVSNQLRELEDVHKVYSEETEKFLAMWRRRIKEYGTNFSRAIEDLRALHDKQREQFSEELSSKRPTKPKLSRDYLNQKKIEESLVKVKQYTQATQVQSAAEELYQSELEQTQQAYEAEQRLKMVKFQAKQQQEAEALLQRGARGRDELELRRVNETERRTYRFRNIVAELENLHKLEVVHLENFLDGQVQAGKAVPLKDGFRRKREALLSTDF